MSKVGIRPATIKDAVSIARGPLAKQYQALVGYITVSDRTYVGEIDGEIVCVWGVLRQSLLSDRGYLWLLTTKEAEEHKFLLVRWSQRIIENLLKNYSSLVGECVIDDYRAYRWMKFLGATFSGAEGKTIPFQIVGKHG